MGDGSKHVLGDTSTSRYEYVGAQIQNTGLDFRLMLWYTPGQSYMGLIDTLNV